jgi:hypothetical protein
LIIVRHGPIPSGEIHPLPPHLLLTKPSTDLSFHIVGPLANANELMLHSALTAFYEAVSLLLRGQVEKRSVLEGLDMVVLAADELCDDGLVARVRSSEQGRWFTDVGILYGTLTESS